MISGDIEHIVEEVERHVLDERGNVVCDGTYHRLTIVAEWDDLGSDIANVHVMGLSGGTWAIARTLGRHDVEFRLIVSHLDPADMQAIAQKICEAKASHPSHRPAAVSTSAGRGLARATY